jgi:hypothetical protein
MDRKEDKIDYSPLQYTCTLGKNQLLFNTLIDTCACGGNYIDESVAQRLIQRKDNDVIIVKRKEPLALEGFNGTAAPAVTHYIEVEMMIGRHWEPKCRFEVADLGKPKVMIGKNWLKEHGCVIDTPHQELWFYGGFCKHEGAPEKVEQDSELTSKRYGPFHPAPQRVYTGPEPTLVNNQGPSKILGANPRTPGEKRPKIRIPKCLMNLHKRVQAKLPDGMKVKDLQPEEKDRIDRARTSGQASVRCTTPKYLEVDDGSGLPEELEYYAEYEDATDSPKAEISVVGAHAFRTMARVEKAEIMGISMRDIIDQHEKEDKRDDDPLAQLPGQFHDLAKAFSTADADKLPPIRGGLNDHTINLQREPDWIPRLYRMSRAEMDEVRKWVMENLSKGFIEASQAPWASPIIFVRKPNGGIRLCVDYRQLNAITKKDRYPLPLIDDIISMLAGCKYITRLDIRHAFNRIRMASMKDEDLTTFATPLGNYKSLVLPFGLCGGPATFQRYINTTLIDYLNDFCSAYMDDVIIFSKTKEEHNHHVRKVLQKLIDAGLQADINKSEFGVQKTKFLGLIISSNGVEMDPNKVNTIVEWGLPYNVRDIQSFIGFCNFYRRFIKDFSRIARPLIELTKDQNKTIKRFNWDDPNFKKARLAFDLLKQAVVSAPILSHFDYDKECIVEVDSSDYVQGGVLSQKGDDGLLHPVAFFSKKLTPAECNYEIYDKELLAIVGAFEQWRPELEGTKLPIQVITDHKALEYFMTTKKLTRRQARWALTLADYNFQISYRPGRQNGKADALTRRASDMPNQDNLIDDRQQEQLQTILGPERLTDEVKDHLRVAAEGDEPEDVLVAPVFADEEEEPLTPLSIQVKEAQLDDATCKRLRKAIVAGERRDPKGEVQLSLCTIQENGLLYRGRLWVPDDMRTQTIQTIHDHPTVGHPGLAKTLFHISKSYYWPRMDKTISRFIRNCHGCKMNKPTRDAYSGVLNPLPIPERPWRHISMDHIVKLPRTIRGCNAIAVQVCRLTKARVFAGILADEDGATDAKATAKLVFETAQRKGVGMIDSFVSDRGSQWDSVFWKELCRLWGVEERMSTAFHPQTDGQSEIINQELERYLRQYCSWQQDDWDEWLFLAEAAQNAAPSESTKVSPFMATNGYEPRMVFDHQPTKQADDRPEHRSKVEQARQFASHQKDIWDNLQAEIKLSQVRMEEFANRKRKPAPIYFPKDYVWLNTKNIKTTRPTKKLDYKNVRCQVIKQISPSSYRVELPEGMQRLHNVFHTSLLSLDPSDPLPDQIQEAPGPIEIDETPMWEVEQILDSRYYYGRCQYRAKWVGHTQPDMVWYPTGNFDHAPDVVRAYHDKYPNKPKPVQSLKIPAVDLENRKTRKIQATERRITGAKARTLALITAHRRSPA